MIVGTGIDLVDIARLEEQLKLDAFKRKVFSEREISDCESHATSAERYAGKFAAKEALMKAIGEGIRQAVGFTQIEVLNNEAGAPMIITNGKAKDILANLKVDKVHVSISHTGGMAIALIILEKT